MPKKREVEEVESESNHLKESKKSKVDVSQREFIIRHALSTSSLIVDDKMCHFKLISWNVNGFRALIKNNPKLLNNLAQKYEPDIICLQEIKLQKEHVSEFSNILNGYQSHWNCAGDKKGYSGTAVFIKNNTFGEPLNENTSSGIKSKQSTLSTMWGSKTKSEKSIANLDKIDNSEFGHLNNNITTHDDKSEATRIVSTAPGSINISNTPLSVTNISYDMDDKKFTGEGRVITIECQYFFFVACYVPNSGEGLRRLDYRLNEWDPKLRSYLLHLNQTKPVILSGDLNVAHLDIDFYNPTAKHISKQAGLTPQERASFSLLLAAGFFDAFRTLHPEARGHYTYWSQRASNRSSNRGLRLDYFVCSNDMLPRLPPPPTPSSSKEDDGEGAEEVEEEGAEVEEAYENMTESRRAADNNSPLTALTNNINRPVVRVVDSYMLHEDTVGFSDHCPILLTIEIKLG